MIYCSNKTLKYRIKRKENWHKWFAWHPVCIETHPDGSKTKIWWQWVLRKGKYIYSFDDAWWNYEYKYLKY
jgi:hypothetical protein